MSLNNIDFTQNITKLTDLLLDFYNAGKIRLKTLKITMLWCEEIRALNQDGADDKIPMEIVRDILNESNSIIYQTMALMIEQNKESSKNNINLKTAGPTIDRAFQRSFVKMKSLRKKYLSENNG